MLTRVTLITSSGLTAVLASKHMSTPDTAPTRSRWAAWHRCEEGSLTEAGQGAGEGGCVERLRVLLHWQLSTAQLSIWFRISV
jgi:hypothetical protein